MSVNRPPETNTRDGISRDWWLEGFQYGKGWIVAGSGWRCMVFEEVCTAMAKLPRCPKWTRFRVRVNRDR